MDSMRKNYIGGEWVESVSGRTFERYNPAHKDERVAVAPASVAADVDQAVDAVLNGQSEWAKTSPQVRADVLMRAATILESRADELAMELVREEGKTLAEAQGEIRRTPQNFRFYAGETHRLSGQTFPSGDGSWIFSQRHPVGVVAAITPWNFPLNIPSRKLGPALAAGNGVVFKPSDVTPLMGQRLVEALLEAGLPGGAVALVHGSGEAGSALARDNRVSAITFTGSTTVGEQIHASTGPTVRCQLEMGGKNAVVVCPDADLDEAASIVMRGAFSLSGQACTGTSRVYVIGEAYHGLLDRVIEAARSTVVGPGDLEGVTMGPLATEAQLQKYHQYLNLGEKAGAFLETPTVGCPLPDNGYFVRPAIFSGVDPASNVAQEEIFGPVLAITQVSSYDDAVKAVNDTQFGLSAGIVTSNMATAMQFSRDADTGLVKVNQPTNGMAINAPFGGMKASSTQTYKEQAGETMMHFYTMDKTVYISS